MNRLEAKIKKIKNKDSLNIVDFSFNENTLTMISLDLSSSIKENKNVLLSIKPTNITIAKNLSGEISFSNKLVSKVTLIEKGELLSNITCSIKNTNIEAIITTLSLEQMSLKVGDEVFVFFKATDLAIMEVIDD